MIHSFILYVLNLWEDLFASFAGAHEIPGGSGILHWIASKHEGPPITLENGQTVETGAAVLDLHFVNGKMREVAQAGGRRYMWDIYHMFLSDLEALAAADTRGELPPYEALYGFTLLGAAAGRCGFESYPAPTDLGSRLIVLWMNILRVVFHPGQTSGLFDGPQPRIVWMSREAFLERYAPGDPEEDQQ